MQLQSFNQKTSPEGGVVALSFRTFLLAESQGYQSADSPTQPNGKGLIKTEVGAGTQIRNPQVMY